MLFGNKQDLCEHNPKATVISRETGAKLGIDNGILFSETSVITVVEIIEAFEVLLQSIRNVKVM